MMHTTPRTIRGLIYSKRPNGKRKTEEIVLTPKTYVDDDCDLYSYNFTRDMSGSLVCGSLVSGSLVCGDDWSLHSGVGTRQPSLQDDASTLADSDIYTTYTTHEQKEEAPMKDEEREIEESKQEDNQSEHSKTKQINEPIPANISFSTQDTTQDSMYLEDQSVNVHKMEEKEDDDLEDQSLPVHNMQEKEDDNLEDQSLPVHNMEEKEDIEFVVVQGSVAEASEIDMDAFSYGDSESEGEKETAGVSSLYKVEDTLVAEHGSTLDGVTTVDDDDGSDEISV